MARVVVGGAREAAEAFVGHPLDDSGRRRRSRAGSSGGRTRSATGRTIRTASRWLGERAAQRRLHDLRLDARGQGRRRDAPAARAARAAGSSPRRPRTRARSRPPSSPSAPVRTSPRSRRSPTRRRRSARAHELGEPVLVTGSLYLLADLEAAAVGVRRRSRMRERLTVARPSRSSSSRPRRNRVRRRVYPRQAPSLTPTIALPIAIADTFFDSSTWALARNLSRVPRRRLLARDRVLGLQGRAPPDRRSVARRDGGPARARAAVRRPDRLPLPAAARLDRGATRPRAREPRPRGAARRTRSSLPGLPRPGRRVVPRLPRLHDAAQAGVQLVRLPARADLAGLPLLRRRPFRPRPLLGEEPLQPLRVRRTS